MPDDKKEPPTSAARAGDDGAGQPFKTAAEEVGITPPEGAPTPGLSQSPGLVQIPGSTVPGLGNGGMIHHVHGPGQAPVDPVAAGLDVNYSPSTANDMRAVTQTGILAAGPRPTTYAEKPDGQMVVQSGPADGKLVRPPQDSAMGSPFMAGSEPLEPIPTHNSVDPATPAQPGRAIETTPPDVNKTEPVKPPPKST